MNRRAFLEGSAALLAGIILPTERIRVYSFAAPWMSEQLRFERALKESADTGRPIRDEFFRIHKTTEFPSGANIFNCELEFAKNGFLDISKATYGSIMGNYFHMKHYGLNSFLIDSV